MEVAVGQRPWTSLGELSKPTNLTLPASRASWRARSVPKVLDSFGQKMPSTSGKRLSRFSASLVGGLRRRPGVLVLGQERSGRGTPCSTVSRKPRSRSVGAGRAGLVADEEDPALAAEELAQAAGGQDAALVVVGGDEADVVLALEAGVDDDDRDLLAHGVLDGPDEGPVVERGQDDAVDAAADDVLDHGDLLGPVVLLLRALSR